MRRHVILSWWVVLLISACGQPVPTERDAGQDAGNPPPFDGGRNYPPYANNATVSTQKNTPLFITLTGYDLEGDPFTFVVDYFPEHGTLTGDAPLLTYTPNQDFLGEDSLIFSCRDGQGLPGNFALITIHVLERSPVWFVAWDAVVHPAEPHRGRSWATAFNHPQDALNVAQPGDQIWVKEGTYARRVTDLLNVQLKPDIALYGGFAGTEARLEQRDVAAHVTVLTGEDRYRVVTGADRSRLDGFTIANGNAASGLSSPADLGGGLFNKDLSITVANCLFRDNRATHGGAMYNQNARPVVLNSRFVGNATHSLGYGGAIANYTRTVMEVRDVLFENNRAGHAGAIINDSKSYLEVTNALFIYNQAASAGAISNANDSSLVLTNCTFDANTISQEHRVATSLQNAYGATALIRNSILWGGRSKGRPELFSCESTCSTTIDRSIIFRGLWAVDPRFVAPGHLDDRGTPTNPDDDVWVSGDYQLQVDSPAIDVGNDALAPATDFLGRGRVDLEGLGEEGVKSDLGAFERQAK